MMRKKRVLFLCTGNYYRSRYAEEVFNHLAVASDMNWEATSRALALERGKHNVGPISNFAVAALAVDKILPMSSGRMPMACTEVDLAGADMIVAVKEAEHRALLAERFAHWKDRATYWHIHDVDQAHPDVALREIKHNVTELAKRLVLTET
jgi:protein-tyrosine-phosphatase